MSDLPAMDLDRVRAFLAAKNSKRQAEFDGLFARACTDFDAIVSAIKADGRAVRIWQWGSLLNRAFFSEISDIDIVVEGLSGPQDYFDLLGLIMNMSAFPIDFVELEKIGEADRRSIHERGSLVNERSG